jgi:serine/threonine-protein kinase
MTPERLKQIDKLARAALERGAEERAAFLSGACGDDESLRREVESRIACQQQASGFLEHPGSKGAAESLAQSQRDTESLEGRTIGHYRVLRKLGAGGMGEVYLAQDASLGRNVAIKFLSHDSVADPQAKRRLIREAHAAAKLDHPNVCTIHEVNAESDHSFIVMQYLEGETLASRIRETPLDLIECIQIAAQVADALAEAHSHGIVHRDVKPQNIMLTSRNQAKVMDFGLAKVVTMPHLTASKDETESLLTGPGTVVGTLPYLSPEQARGDPIDARSDIFSLGVVMYEMLSGRHPFKGHTNAATISMILTHEPLPLSRFLPEIPDELQRIVGKALRKDKERRYQAMRELQIDLINLLEELTFQAKLERSEPPHNGPGKEPELPQVSSKRGIHQRTLIAALIFLIIIMVGSAILYFSSGNQSNSVAVLPFSFTSADPRNLANPDSEYLADGITESVINSLSQFPSMKVIARSSVFRYKGKDVDPQQVGRELGVRTVLIGRIIQRGDNLTIRTELSDVQENRQIWGEQYDRKVSALLALQAEIANSIIDKFRSKLAGGDRNRLAKSFTGNAEAYGLYLKGRYYWNKRTGEGLRKAIAFFQKAIDEDPKYALAYVGLADSYMLLSDWGFLSPTEGYSIARDAVLKALIIDDELAEAHTSLAAIKDALDWDWASAENEYRKAIELNSNYSTAHHWYATHLMVLGRMDESIAQIKQAQQLDPLSLGINKDFAVILLYARRYDQAYEQCTKTLEIDPNFLVMSTYIAQSFELKKMFAEAIAELERANAQSPNDVEISTALAQAYAAAGRNTQAQEILSKLSQPSMQSQSVPKEMALLHAWLGEKDKAFEILNEAYENHYLAVAEIKMDPRFDVLRSDARYTDLLRRLGLSG